MEEMERRTPPPWPIEKNWVDIVRVHNKIGKFKDEKPRSASESITLIMICAAIGAAIPINLLRPLKLRDSGIGDHFDHIIDYLEAAFNKTSPEKGNGVEKQVKRLAPELGVSTKDINESLAKAFLKFEKIQINGWNSF